MCATFTLVIYVSLINFNIMIVSYNWLQEYFKEPLPEPKSLGLLLNTRAFEVEGITTVGDDVSIDIDVQPNRAHDCFSHYGIAKEISTLTNQPYVELEFLNNTSTAANPITVTVEDARCVRYMSTYISAVQNSPSIELHSKKLQTLGQRSINTIVDITNIVMFELGQPVHVFDANKIVGNTIVVRAANEGEQLTTLDGTDVTFAGGELVIADEAGPLAIAGIKGGNRAGVTLETKNIVLEAASFEASNIRKTSRTLGISTDSSKRFERDIAPQLAEKAMQRLIVLLQEHCAADALNISQTTDVYPRPYGTYKTGVSLREVNEYLGTSLTATDIETVLTRLQFPFEKVKPHEHVVAEAASLVGKAPYVYGASVLRDAPHAFDCSSFTAYLYKEAGVSIPRVTVDQFMWGAEITEAELQPGDIIFCDIGKSPLGEDKQFYHTETVDYMQGTSLPVQLDHNGIYIGDGMVVHASSKAGNTVAQEALADSVIFSNIVGYRRMAVLDEERYVITVPDERLDIRIPQDVIEEIGRVYGYEHIGPTPITESAQSNDNATYVFLTTVRAVLAEQGFSEIMTPTFVATGDIAAQKALASDKGFLRTTLVPGITDALALNEKNLDLLGLDRIKLFEIGHVFTHKGEALHIAIGVSGKKSQPIIEEALKTIGVQGTIQGGVVEIVCDTKALPNIDAVALPQASNVVFKSFSPYPYITRDIAVWVPKHTTIETVEQLILSHTGELLVTHRLFDVYEKDERVSLAFRLVFQSFEKTLTDEAVAPVMDAITSVLVEQEGYEVR